MDLWLWLGVFLISSYLASYTPLLALVTVVSYCGLSLAFIKRLKLKENRFKLVLSLFFCGGCLFGRSLCLNLTTNLHLPWQWLDLFTNNRRLFVPILVSGYIVALLWGLKYLSACVQQKLTTFSKRYFLLAGGVLLIQGGIYLIAQYLAEFSKHSFSLNCLLIVALGGQLVLSWFFYSYLLAERLVKIELSWASVICLIIPLLLIGKQNQNYLTKPLKQPVEVIAHRGVNDNNGLGNSMIALKRTAKQVHPNLVEMDIQETKDQGFIVSHDEDLKRLTGKNLVVSQTNLHQLQGLKERQGNQIASLVSFNSYLQQAKKLKQPLLIELKACKPQMGAHFNQQFGRQLGNRDLIHTMSLQVLGQLKQVNPDLKVGYVLPINMWGLPNVSADFYSLEKNTLTRTFVYRAHQKKQAVYVWTVNKPSDIRVAIAKGADGIISDKASLVRKQLKLLKKDQQLLSLTKFKVSLNELGYGLRI